MKQKTVLTFAYELVQVERLDNRNSQQVKAFNEPEVLRVTLSPLSPNEPGNFIAGVPFTFTTLYFSELGQFLLTSPIGRRFEIQLNTLVLDYQKEEEPYQGPMYNA